MTEINQFIDAVKSGDFDTVDRESQADPSLVNRPDASGALPLHYATLNGYREIARLLVKRGADVNRSDGEFGGTPAGWAIEYLRQLGGFLAIELEDLAYAIEQEDVRWVSRFLQRFPALRRAHDTAGKSFLQAAKESGNREIIALFESPSQT